MIEKLFEDFIKLEQVEAILLGGSRASNNYDEKSDYDIYIYYKEMISEEIRKNILAKYCKLMELGNHFWEYEDNCVLKNGIDIDILYRDIKSIKKAINDVVFEHNVFNGYTTCLWHNLINSKIIYDENNSLLELKNKFSIPYPNELKKNIINHNKRLLNNSLPQYRMQIQKAINRNDIISMNHRTSAFFESYFDILFALNEKTHPGEKRLIDLVIKECKIIPNNFSENINNYFKNLFTNSIMALNILDEILKELEKIL